MNDLDLISFLIGTGSGLILGVLANLAYNKLRSGNASPTAVKKELEEYQQRVEAHFDETSNKFRAMAEQYKDLYQHLSVGATTLCRPEHVVPGLSDESNPLQSLPKNSAPANDEKASKQAGDNVEIESTKEAAKPEPKKSEISKGQNGKTELAKKKTPRANADQSKADQS